MHSGNIGDRGVQEISSFVVQLDIKMSRRIISQEQNMENVFSVQSPSCKECCRFFFSLQTVEEQAN